ncbi:hypothetical protein [Brasilonema sennae]|uniref:hypothetical protein n=1 Tax=Brasilonema sennae TaxID=1397703 RepID=UPI001C13180D|nr:hypothetical protein [Brasilonema sennae]
MKQPKLPAFLWELFQKLRRRGFPLTPDDYETLRQSLQAGFGWSSQEALRDLCNSLWAKSRQEQEILTALFNQLAPKNEDWQLSSVQAQNNSDGTDSSKKEQHQDVPEAQKHDEIVTESRSGLPPIFLKDVQLSERRFIFVPLSSVQAEKDFDAIDLSNKEQRQDVPKPQKHDEIVTESRSGLPPIFLKDVQLSERRFIFVPLSSVQAEKDFDAIDLSNKEQRQDVPKPQKHDEIVTESRSGLPPIFLKDVQLSERRFIFVPLSSVQAEKDFDAIDLSNKEQRQDVPKPQKHDEIVTESRSGLPPIFLKDVQLSERRFIFVPLSSVQAEKDFDAIDLSNKEQRQDVPKPQKHDEIVTESRSGLPPIFLKDVQLLERRFIFVPQFPLTYREVAQTWRRLRRPVRVGPATELDVESTIMRRCQQVFAASVVLRPRRRNVARLLMLVDRQGSMTPFHRFCEEVCRAIQQAGRLEETAIYYFHNVPAEGADEQVLEPLGKELFPVLDSILPQITPLKTGYLYEDSDLLSPIALEEVLQKYAADAFVVMISDAGAVRKCYNVVRLLDTISFIKALRAYTLNYVWLNPLPKSYWKDNTAAQIARHVPMFPLNREGIYQAVNVLRGQQYNLEKPF